MAIALLLLTACEVVHTTECVPPPPGQPGCADVDPSTSTDSDPPRDTGDPSEVIDTGWPPGEWAAALQHKDRAYATIQDAIVDATDGDTVLVAPGTHYENIDFHGKAIRVRSTHGAAATVLDGGDDGSVVSLRAQEPSTAILEGFTITNGKGTEDHGGGIFVENADPLILHNVVIGNRANIGGGIYLRHGYATVTNNLILGNEAAQGGGGLTCTNCKGVVRFNTFYENEADLGPAAEWYYEPEADLTGNVLVLRTDATHAIRFLEPILEGAFDNTYNLLWPHVPWVLEGAPDFPEGEGLVYEEPIFLDAAAGDWRLAPGSPGVDQGPPQVLDPDGTRADMGAFGGEHGGWSPESAQ